MKIVLFNKISFKRLKIYMFYLACVTCRPCGSVAQWSEYSHGLRGVLGSRSDRAVLFFLPCVIWWLSVCPCLGWKQQRDCLVGSGMVPADSGMN